MATGPERSRPLHNFTLPRLKWGKQRLLRCMKVNENNGVDRRLSASEAESDGSNRNRASTWNEVIKRGSPETFRRSSPSPLKPIHRVGGEESTGIEAVREKLLSDLRVAADKIKVSILEEKKLQESNSAAVRPWNLRTRRAACKAPNEPAAGCGGANHRNNSNPSPSRPESPMAAAAAKSSRLRGLAAAAALIPEQNVDKRDKAPRAKFSISLSREEVERDFLATAGIRPPRRPKKRAKLVQKQVDAIFPGFWLTEITPETYKVPDFPEPGQA